MASKGIKGITVKIGGDTVGLQKALSDVNRRSGELNAELRQVNNALKFDPTNTTLLSQKQQLLAEQVKNTSDKLQQLRSVQGQIEQQYKSGEIGAEAYRAFQRELASTESRLASLETEEQSVGRSTGEAAQKTRDFSGALNGAKAAADVFSAAAGVVVNGLVSVATGAIDAGKELASMIDDVGKAGDAIDKSSQAAGMSSDAYQEWGYVLQRNGASADSLATWMKKLNNNVDDAVSGTDSAVQKFERLGLSVDNLQNMSREDVFAQVIASLQGMENESERAAAVNDILGGSATDLGALLHQTAEDTDALRENAHTLGLVMSEEGVSDSAAYADALLDMQSAMTGVKNRIAADILPSFTDVVQGVTGMIIGTENADKTFSDGIDSIADKIAELSPKVGETLGEITVATGDLLPALAESASSMVDAVISAIAVNAPKVAENAGNIAVILAEGISENTDTILRAVTSIGATVLSTLPDILGDLVSSAGDFAGSLISFFTRSIRIVGQQLPAILETLAEALTDAVPELTEMIFTLITTAADTVLTLLPEILPTVVNLVTSLIAALVPQTITAVVALVQSVADNLPMIIEVLTSALPTLIGAVLTAILGQAPAIISGVGTIIISLAESLPQMIALIIAMIPTIISQVVSEVLASVPQLVRAGLTLFTSLVSALPDIILGIVDAIPEIIGSVIDALVENIPLLVECGIELFMALVENLPEIIKGIEQAVTKIISGIVTKVKDLHGDLVQAGSAALLKLVDDIPRVIESVKSKAGEIVQGIIDTISSKYSDLIDAGYNLITGMWQGIENAKDWIIEKIGGFTDSVVDAFKDFFDIHSPSHRIEAEVGEYNGMAIGTGTVKAMPKVKSMIKSATESLFDDSVFTPAMNLSASDLNTVSAPALAGAAAGGSTVINFTMQIDQFDARGESIESLSERAMDTLYRYVQRNKLSR